MGRVGRDFLGGERIWRRPMCLADVRISDGRDWGTTIGGALVMRKEGYGSEGEPREI